MNNLITSLVQNRWPYFIASITLLILLSFQIAHMAFNGNVKVMFDENDPHFQRLKQLEHQYIESSYLVFLFQPEDKNIFSHHSLDQLQTLSQAIANLPYVQRTDSLLSFPKLEIDKDTLSINPLVENIHALKENEFEQIKDYLQENSTIAGHLTSLKHDAAAVYAAVNLTGNHLSAIHQIGSQAQQLQEIFLQQHPGSQLYLNGDIAIERALLNVIMDDILRVNPIVFFVIFVLVGLLLRSLMAITATLAVVAVSTGIATGINVSLGFEMNPITMMAPAIIMVLAVADSIHVLTIYSVQCRQGIAPQQAMLFSLKKNLSPIFWTSATTVAGFMGLNFGDSPPFRSMGNMAAIGVVFAFLCTFTVLPTVALAFPGNNISKPWSITHLMRRLSGWKGYANPIFLLASLLVSVILASFIPRMILNDDISEYFDESLPIHKSIQFAKNNIRGVQNITYSFDSGIKNGIHEPEFLTKVDDFSQWLRQHPQVSQVNSYTDIVKRLHKTFNDDDPAYNVIPDSRQLNSQYELLYEMSLPVGMDLTRDINQDRSQIKLTVSLHNSDNQTLIQLEKDIDQWLENNMPELKNLGSSQLLMFAHMGNNILHSMISGSAYTLLFITLFMIFALRSLKFGLLSIVPNVFPALVVYGLWALMVGRVNHAAAMTFTICLGLVVDDSIHLISKYLDARRNGSTQQQALEYSFIHSGTAIVITSITLTCGILLLSLSHFAVNDTMALMLASIIVLALLFDLLVLPALLMLFDRKVNFSPSQLKEVLR